MSIAREDAIDGLSPYVKCHEKRQSAKQTNNLAHTQRTKESIC